MNKELTANEESARMDAFLNRKTSAMEIVGGIITMALFTVLAWLFLIATTPQMSAECEYERSQMQAD